MKKQEENGMGSRSPSHKKLTQTFARKMVQWCNQKQTLTERKDKLSPPKKHHACVSCELMKEEYSKS